DAVLPVLSYACIARDCFRGNHLRYSTTHCWRGCAQVDEAGGAERPAGRAPARLVTGLGIPTAVGQSRQSLFSRDRPARFTFRPL
ncbi:MAG: hypothetical protein ACRDTT_06535, partial [Pseudonocardiaceae bacterium]